jgi:endonuclease YncB( thermonuclease family)
MTPALILCALLAVSDGDTIVCRTDAGVERVRIWGLHCPELGQPGGYAASMAMAKLLRRPIELKLKPQSGADHPKCKRPGHCDHFGRTVAMVFAKRRDVARRMIASKVCVEFCKFSDGKYGTCPSR